MGYLVISRKVAERIRIGKDIEILVSDIQHKKVDIAINAPKSMKILRLKTHIEEEKEKNGNSNKS